MSSDPNNDPRADGDGCEGKEPLLMPGSNPAGNVLLSFDGQVITVAAKHQGVFVPVLCFTPGGALEAPPMLKRIALVALEKQGRI